MKLIRLLLALLAAIFRRRKGAHPPPADHVPTKPKTSTGKKVVVGGGAAIALATPLIMGFEGLYTKAYRDPVGIPTICYGHIENVKMGDKFTPAQCKELLQKDLPRYDKQVLKCIKVPMSNGTHAALISFTYNVGGGALCKSSVARKINAGDLRGGCDALLLYNKAGGRVLKGLERRRAEERKLCLSKA